MKNEIQDLKNNGVMLSQSHVECYNYFLAGNIEAVRLYLQHMSDSREKIFKRGLTHRINRLNFEGRIMVTAEQIKDNHKRDFFLSLVQNRFDRSAAILSKVPFVKH